MRRVDCVQIVEAVAKLCSEINIKLNPGVRNLIEEALKKETSSVGREILYQLLENAEIAYKKKLPLCQDTGMAVAFLELGQEVKITGGNLYDAINEGVRIGYKREYLRNSVVRHPFYRVNTGDNTPVIIHTRVVEGDVFNIYLMAKGGGSENTSALKMLTPAEGRQGVEDFVVQTVSNAGANPCPPLIIGVGIGGNFELAPLLAKEAILKSGEQKDKRDEDRELERTLLNKINRLGIGPQGLGGRTTALAVYVNTFPCHIASLPVAVNINCHSSRHGKINL